VIGRKEVYRTLTIALLLLAARAGPVIAQRPDLETVIEVRVAGNQRLSANAILADVRTRVGEVYDETIVKDDQRRLLQTGRFESVTATRTQTDKGVIVTFVVVERPVVTAVIFEGNKAFTDSALAKDLTFGVSDAVNLFAIESGRQAILNKYRSRGHHEARVTLDMTALREERRVIYHIVEGPRVVVRKIRFKGNKFFSTWKLRQRVGVSARIWPFKRGYLDKEQMERDVHTIRNLYVSKGFLDAKVGRILTLSDEGKKVTVTFVIDEGPRYRVNRILFEGNEVFSDEQLSRRLSLAPGEYLTTLTLQRDVGKVQDTYGELGYIEAEVWAEKLYKEQPGIVDLVFQVKEANKYLVGKIMIRGNTFTQSRVIRRELGIYPRQPVNTVAMGESRRRLLETGLFRGVVIRPVGKEPDIRDVWVQVEESETAQFLLGASLSSNVGLLGNIGLTQRNFDILRFPTSWSDVTSGRAWRGAGQTFSLSVEPGTELSRFHVDWFEPALFDRPYSLGTKGFLFTRGREKYDETRFGGVVSLGHMFKNRWYGELAARVEGVDINDLDSGAPPEVVRDRGSHMLVGLKGTLVRDRTDSRWLPSTGDRLRISYEQMVGDFNFGRGVGEYRIYGTLYVDPTNRKHILAGRLGVGHIFGSAPVFERFYGGGHGSVRGFEYRGISPRSRGTNDQIGGDLMLFAGAEYEFPLIGEHLRGVVFVDSGTVEDTFEITTYRVSAGLGLRWIVPLLGPVPMNLDFGFPISKHGKDDTEIFSFSIGWMF
jgi:outer membrane protein assembly complex protein YaeT